MKLFKYLEAITRDVTELSDLGGYSIIIFDIETNGLIGEEGLQLIKSAKYDPSIKKTRYQYHIDDSEDPQRELIFNPGPTELHIAEISAASFNPITKKRDSIHFYVKANLEYQTSDGKPIKDLISWDDIKEASARPIKEVLKKFESFLNQFDKKIIIAHNGGNFDFKIMNLIGEKFGMYDLKNTFNLYHPNEDNILVDTVNNKQLRMFLKNLPWPKRVGPDGKEKLSNKQTDLMKMFNIKDLGVHTAKEDVRVLSRYFANVLKKLRDVNKETESKYSDINFTKPSYESIQSQIEKIIQGKGYRSLKSQFGVGIPVKTYEEEIKDAFNDGKLETISRFDFNRLEDINEDIDYSDIEVGDLKKIERAIKKRENNYSEIYNSLVNNKRIEAPVIIFQQYKNPLLVSGESTMMISRALGFLPKIYRIDVK